MKTPATFRYITFGLIAVLPLTACNWVDSTGRQSNEKPTIILDDGTPNDGYSLNLNEEASAAIDPSSSADSDGTIVSWSWDKSASAAGALDACANVDGFNASYAADSLRDACTDPNNCALQIITEEIEKTAEEIAEDQAEATAAGISIDAVSDTKTRFIITAPKLKAPVGLTHRVSAQDNDGGSGFAEVTLCLIAINEAPEANDDVFAIVEGSEKLVTRSSSINLLSNDTDDIDVTNKPLTVNPAAVTFPKLSQSFSLMDDGGFSYFFQGDPARPAGEEIIDNFSYEITDGFHTSQADVTLKIVTVDDPPTLKSAIPDQTFIAGIKRSYDFRKHFDDPEGSSLVYSEPSKKLPASFNQEDLIKGKLTSTPSNAEVSSYDVTIAASDGNSETSDSVLVRILGNKPPSWKNIANQSGTFNKFYSLNLSNYANDPEGFPLFYTMKGNPGFLKLKGSKIEGTPNRTGDWTIKLTASDGFNAAVSNSFKFSVEDQPPVFKNIPNQTTAVRNSFSLDLSKYASDPEGQSLSYSMSGNPGFLKLNGSKIQGTPNQTGEWTIKVFADDGKHTASSKFTLKVNNPKPKLVSAISSKTFDAGENVNFSVASNFSDANDDLEFTASGLPGNLSISKSGVISGTAVSVGTSTVTVTAKEVGGSQDVSGDFQITIKAVVVNNPPELDPIPDQEATVGVFFTFDASDFASDPDGDSLQYSFEGPPPGFLDQNGPILEGTPNRTITRTITVIVSDSKDSVSGSFTFNVTEPESEPSDDEDEDDDD